MLVVDDEEEVREVAVAHLEALGYDAVLAPNGRVALDLLSRDSGAIDVLLVDYAIPGMSGMELIRRVRARQPNLPVVLMTGSADLDTLDETEEGIVFLRKPYRMQELAAALDNAPPGRAAT